MATTIFETWYDDVIPHVGGCPVAVAKQKIRQAAIEFCKLSRTWRYRALTAIDAVATQQDYVIGAGAAVGTLPPDTVIAHVFQVNYDGIPLDPETPAQFRARGELWFSEAGTPEGFTLFVEGVLSLAPIPSAGLVGGIVLPEVALAPSQTAAGIDSAIYERWREAISIGARAYIHQIPKKPYTDMNLGMDLERRFIAASGSANARTASGRGQARLRTRTIYR